MNNYRSLCTGLAFALIFSSGITATTSLAAPLTDNKVHKIKKSLPHEQRVEIRKSEEKRIAKSQEKAYKKQMEALEKYYRKLALDVRKKGGNATPLSAATDHFKQLSKEAKNSRK